MMKRLACLFLTAALVLALAACGGPKFDPNALSEAQAYAKAALAGGQLVRGHEVKTIYALLTSDLRADLQAWVPLDAWDVSDVTALVVVQSGTPRQGPEVAALENPPLLFLLDGEKQVLYKHTPGSGSDIPSSEEEVHATLAALEEQIEQAESEAQAYAQENKDAAAFAPLVDRYLKYDPGFLDSQDFFNLCKGNLVLLEYGGYRRTLRNLETRLDTLRQAEDFDAATALLDSDQELQRKILELRYLAWEIQGKLAQQDRRVLSSLADAARQAQKDPAALFTQDHLRQCLTAGEATVACDGLLRQQLMVERSLADLEACTQSDSLEERAYLQERSDVIVLAMADYATALYDSVAKDQAWKDFQTAHEQDLSAYDQGLAAAKERAGASYETDPEYETLQRQYGGTVQEQQDLQAAAQAASQAAEKVKSDVQAKVAKLDRQESQRLATVDEEMQKDALYDYVCAMTPPTASEYTVQPGQWGQLDGSFIPYLNSILGRGS